jgi:hypothetical protein
MTLKQLRKEAPSWSWTAHRHGMGWQYVGSKDRRQVTIYAVAVLSGPCEDDFIHQWRADNGIFSKSYYSWLADELDPADTQGGR